MDKSRTEMLLGKATTQKLAKFKILVVGLGGVGGIASEMLVRTGIENLTIVDYDIISSSNLNRQVIALSSNIGKSKVEELKNRLLSINPDCTIQGIDEKLTEENIPEIVSQNFDYVIDAIDDVKNKTNLIVYCKTHDINIISALGAGKRTCNPSYEITDIYKTQNDGLAKVMRKNLKEKGVKSHKVCYSMQNRVETTELGSVVWHPTACACVIVSEVINNLTKE